VIRKRRTREHVLADLSESHVLQYVYQCRFTAQRIERDYGVDLVLFTYDPAGQIENGYVLIQLKATDHLRVLQDGQAAAFVVERADLEHWLAEPFPVILIVYDAPADVAYWLYVQAYFAALPGSALERPSHTLTVHIPLSQVVNAEAIRKFARFKQRVLDQARGAIRHDL
jgi:hypothetical protein